MSTVNNPSTYAGKKIVVTFEAVINDEADVENGVVNELDNYGTPRSGPDYVWHRFDFTKVDPDGKGIKDVTFQVKDGDTTLYFVKQKDGSYKKAASATTSGATADVKTGADGKLSFTGLDKNKTTPSRKLCAPAMPTSTSCRALLCLSARRTVQLF